MFEVICVGVLAAGVIQDGGIQTPQTVRVVASRVGVAPFRDETRGSSAGTAGRQGHRADIAVQGGGLAQLNKHDVVVQITAAVARMPDNFGRVNPLLGAFADSNVVLCSPRCT